MQSRAVCVCGSIFLFSLSFCQAPAPRQALRRVASPLTPRSNHTVVITLLIKPTSFLLIPQIATVTSAVKLENEQQFMIAKKIQEMTGAKNIKLKPEVDPSLLGGFVVTYGKDGSGYIDMSVAGQINTLKTEVVLV